MNKLWTNFLIVAIIVIFIFIGYEVYLASSGANTTFSRSVTKISPNLGTEKLEAFAPLTVYMPLNNSDLDNK